MTSRESLRRAIDQAQVHDLDTGAPEPLRDLIGPGSQSLLEPRKLCPVSLESDCEQSNSEVLAQIPVVH
jgi:hypothetical protein